MKKTKFSLRFTVGGMFLLATILTTLVAISLQYHFSKKMAAEQALSLLSVSSTELSEYVQDLEVDATSTAKLLASISRTLDMTADEIDIRDILSKSMEDNPLFYSIYIGADNNQFYQVINLESSPIVRQKIVADKSDRWVVIKITGEPNKRIRETYYYNHAFELRELKTTQSNYFPSVRPWFISANADSVTKTKPYLFQHLKITGQTYSLQFSSKSNNQQNYVLGIDIVLSSLASKLSVDKLNLGDDANIESFIYLKSGEVIASNRKHVKTIEVPVSKRLDLSPAQERVLSQTTSIKMSNQNDWAPIDFAASGEPKGYAIDVLNLIEDMTGIDFEFINGFTWAQLVGKYNNGSLDGLHSLQKSNANSIHGAYSAPIYNLPFSIVTKDSIPYIRDYAELEGKKVAILSGWSIIPALKQDFPNIELIEFQTLKAAFESVSLGETSALLDSAAVLDAGLVQYFYQNLRLHQSFSIASQGYLSEFHIVLNKKYEALIPIINLAIRHITPEQRLVLQRKWMDERQLLRGDIMIPYPELLALANQENVYGKIVKRIIDGEERFIYISPIKPGNNATEFFSVIIPKDVIYSGVNKRVVMSVGITLGIMLLILPLAWLFSGPIVRPIYLLRLQAQQIKHRDYDLVELVDTSIKEIWDLSNSLTEMSTALKQHEAAQEEFLEAFIKLIAQAIDDKSAYTAGHCNRVPELGIMLAEAVELSDATLFKDFKFANADEKREFRIAAWLHDCGKITTPEYIVDKGSKLETNYNRIHEIRARFEILWRDAEIAALKQRLATPADKVAIDAELASKQRQLTDDFEFIATSNVGGEFMSNDKIERIKSLSSQTWLRHFDDSIGLSPVEELAKAPASSVLPAVEQLLSDKPEHIIKRERNVEFDPKHGIKMDVPEHQYNLGEVYNLTISRGTLTLEDRYKINEHMISTIKMLENLPFPPELSRVPRYASTHHETLKGTGYPRKLTADDLSIPERILVIADIFEALTASDRPYKKAKPVSVAVDIMHKMALDEHLDIELFKLFLQSGTHVKYALQYLKPEQLDEVDLSRYL
ncbi:MAG: transporter substrate-binding domain-containing protein [Moritella sp.]|uniref:HD domain-containing phosphohydrolase n=1 Tax=Moritella sp. TaxID=78556 RepID=UPI00299FCE93|nr:HD domain-containing phosphohydrolase [Moritella sp.]MDX2320216.1 transporter substrate-binding domain-containing protein [Moritella sp.]